MGGNAFDAGCRNLGDDQLICLLGYGISTIGVAHYLESRAQKFDWCLSVAEQKIIAGIFHYAQPVSKIAQHIKKVVISPGIPPNDIRITGCSAEVMIDIDFFQSEAVNPSARWIGVSATNGKSTFVAKLVHLLSMSGFDACGVGNFGVSPFTRASAEIYVVELSSFQLHYAKSLKLDVGVLGHISPDHITWHGSESAYREAKLRMADFANTFIQEAFSDDLLVQVCTALGSEIEIANLKSFEALPYRLSHVGFKNGWDVFNDSKATNLSACLHALNQFDASRAVYLICGGVLKESLTEEWVSALSKEHVRPIFYGQCAQLMASHVRQGVVVSDFCQALRYAMHDGDHGVILLSPACSSFDQYDHYMHRGQVFDQEVKNVVFG